MLSPRQDTASFDHPPSPEELLAEYRKSEEKDPTSLYYKRHLARPSLNIKRVLFFCFLALCASSFVALACFFFFEKIWLATLTGASCLFLLFLLFLKRILIWLVKCYQHFAPRKTRERCRYEPSCSEYMILSIQKRGVIHGICKGLRRWRSFKPPNGGFDPP